MYIKCFIYPALDYLPGEGFETALNDFAQPVGPCLENGEGISGTIGRRIPSNEIQPRDWVEKYVSQAQGVILGGLHIEMSVPWG